jgi:hypothetical protein
VHEKCNVGFPVMGEFIRIRALELSCQTQIPVKFIASTRWSIRICAGLTLRWHTTLTQKPTSEYSEDLVDIQRHVIKLRPPPSCGENCAHKEASVLGLSMPEKRLDDSVISLWTGSRLSGTKDQAPFSARMGCLL